MKTKIMLFWIVCSVMTTNVILGQGTILLEHTGATDPTSEGFTFSTYPEIVGPVLNDQGVDAWSIHATNSEVAYYSYVPTLSQQSEMINADWSLSVTVRLIQSGSIGVALSVGSEGGFFLDFGIDANGDPTVQAGSSSPVFVLSNAGSTYNNYQLLYSAANDTASLWLNGVEEDNNIIGDSNYAGWGLAWGKFQSSYLGSQADWNLVSLEIVPEPSPAWLLFLGSGIFMFLRMRNRSFGRISWSERKGRQN